MRTNVENRGAELVKVTSELAQLDTGKFPDINVRRRQAPPDDSCFRSEKVIRWAGIAGDYENSASSGRRCYSTSDLGATACRGQR